MTKESDKLSAFKSDRDAMVADLATATIAKNEKQVDEYEDELDKLEAVKAEIEGGVPTKTTDSLG